MKDHNNLSKAEFIQQRSTEELKLAALRAAVREGLESGPTEPLDMEAIIAEARAGHQRRT
jgi:Arc/MetJ-type ribon-helix-helix transcriptional regulator